MHTLAKPRQQSGRAQHANAIAEWEMHRPLMVAWVESLDAIHLGLLRSVLFSAALLGIEESEKKGRA